MVAIRPALQLSVTLIVAIAVAALAAPSTETRIVDAAIISEQVSPSDIPDFIARHHGLAAEALDRDPAVVAAWWAALPDRDRRRMPGHMPDVIGNLAGVDYSARDRANRSELTRRIADMVTLSRHRQMNESETQELAALHAIESALVYTAVPRSLVELTTDQPPLAAISVGNLDTARLVTFAVPGMATYTTDMQLWTRAAKNIYDAQAAAGASGQAVVAWIGYRTPPVGVEATRDAYAERGAELLERDILGLRASRGDGAQPIVNIVAHSYGATTAAKALATELGVRSFVMLGSAGVDSSLSTVDRLHSELVFSGEAAKDTQARWGRVERVDPSLPGFGALHLGVDGDPIEHLLPVTGHAPIIHSPWNDDPTSPAWTKYRDADIRGQLYEAHMRSFGYLDVGTQSLAEVGLATTPPRVRARA
jgi:hypothetical protein